MKIPKKVRIAGIDYKVKYPYKFLGYAWAAEIDHNQHKILVADHSNSKQKKSKVEIESAFLHEIVHGICRRYLPFTSRLNESQVEQVSAGLYQVLKDNHLQF